MAHDQQERLMPSRRRLTFANVVSVLALFVALGGGAYAATQLPPNSVGTPQLRKGAVNSNKIKDRTIVGADVNKSKLGAVPRATQADNAAKLGGSPPSAFTPGPRAYAHVSHGALVAADSKGVLGMSVGCGSDSTFQGICDTAGNPDGRYLCFRLGFTPKVIEVTPEFKPSPSGSDNTANDWAAAVPAPTNGVNHGGCPSGSTALVFAEDSANTAHVWGVYITFD
jgi:hypothetical protein